MRPLVSGTHELDRDRVTPVGGGFEFPEGAEIDPFNGEGVTPAVVLDHHAKAIPAVVNR
jgi:hypothetical protein